MTTKEKLNKFIKQTYDHYDQKSEEAEKMSLDGSPSIATYYQGEANAYFNILRDMERAFSAELDSFYF